MKKIQLSVLALCACTNLVMAGGDINPINPITPYEIEDMQLAEITPLPPVVEAPVIKAPIVEAPTVVEAPVVVEAPTVVKDPVVVTPMAEISPIYVGLGLVAARYDAKCTPTPTECIEDETGGVLLRAGYDFNKYVGIEGRGMMTFIDDDGGKIQHMGLFLKPMYPLTDDLNIYGLGGFAKTTTKGSMRKTDVTGLAFGAGLEYDFSDDKKKDAKYDREFDGIADQEKGFGVFVDYERLYYKSGSPDLDAISIGLTYDF